MFEIQVQTENSVLKWRPILFRINLVWQTNLISDTSAHEKQVFPQRSRDKQAQNYSLPQLGVRNSNLLSQRSWLLIKVDVL